MMSLAQAAEGLRRSGLEVRLRGDAGVRFSAVSTDTRTIAAGSLFVALRGPRFDGHDFAGPAQAAGASCLLVEHELPGGLPQLVVPDTRRALGELAGAWRARRELVLIAVTGSNGKTTTTQMIASILAKAYASADPAAPAAWFATRGNRNNDIGVPQMLLELRASHRAAVLELGMNHPGEIARLAAWVRPSVALVTNAQREHQEFLDSAEATARENGGVLAALAPGGTAVFPADDPCAPIWRQAARGHRVLDFALRGPAAVSGRYGLQPQSAELDLHTPAGRIETVLSLGGEHNVRNALAATAAALAAGVAADAIAAGLGAFRAVSGRGTRRSLPGGAVLIDDSYNANPDSLRAAIDLLAGQPGRRALVFGDMGEVGARGPEFHREIGGYARERGIERMLALGELARLAVEAFGEGAAHFERLEDLVEAARSLTAQSGAPGAGGWTLLVKGSRFMRLERVVEALSGPSPGGAAC